MSDSKEKIIVLDRGNLEFLYPGDWNIAKAPAGYVVLSDPSESCRLDVSYSKVPDVTEPFPVELLLRRLLRKIPEAGDDVEITTSSAPHRRFAWADQGYPSTDKRTGDPRAARGRWLLGTNDVFQVLMNFHYWEDDLDWAVPCWERIVETIQLGDGTQLSSPEEHWSHRQRH